MAVATFRQIQIVFTEEKSRVSLRVMAKPLTEDWTRRHVVLHTTVPKPWDQALRTFEDVLMAVVVLIEEEMLPAREE